MKLRNLLIAATAALTMGAVPALAQQTRTDDGARSGTSSGAMPGSGSSTAPRAATDSAAPGQNKSAVMTVIQDDDKMVAPYNITVGKLEGTDVMGAGNQKIGDVEDVLADSSGQAVAVSVDAGSFFKMNKKQVVMQLKDLQMRDGKLVSSMTQEQVSALPDYNE